MPAVQAGDIPDLVIGALNAKGAPNFVNLLPSQQRYEVFGSMYKKRKKIPGGRGLEKQIALDATSTAEMTGLYDVDNYQVNSHLATLTVPFRHTKDHYTWDRREMLFNEGSGGPANPAVKIVDILQPREINTFTSIANLMETQGFGVPSSSSDTDSVYGFRYWLPSSATTGFNGQNPSGFSDKGGIDASTKTNFRNYTAEWTDVSRTDLAQKMAVGFRQIRWKAPHTTKDAQSESFSNYKIYMRGTTIDDLELIGEGQNENIGKNIGMFNGNNLPGFYKDGVGDLTFKRIPLCWVPSEDDQSDNSVWMINLDSFYIITLKGDEMVRTQVQIPNQHNNFAVWIDLTWNMVLENPRSCARFIKAS